MLRPLSPTRENSHVGADGKLLLMHIEISGVDPKTLPRLLVFSHVVPESRFAGSVLLMRLLRGYPVEKLLVLGPQPDPRSNILACRYEPLPDARMARAYRSRFARLARSVAVFGLGSEICFDDKGPLVRDFQPQVVLTVMQESQFYRAACRYCVRNGLPLILLVHDLAESFEPVYSWAVKRQRQLNTEVYRAAAERLCISPAMALRLQQTYGAEGSIQYPNRDEELVPRPLAMNESLRTEGRLTIGYAGSLSYGYLYAIQEILPALRRAGVSLRVYSSQITDLGEGVTYAGFSSSPLETWERIKAECDAVLMPYSWLKEFQALYETHFPSKLPEYLALGMPLFIVGPSYAAGVAWGLAHPGAAVTVNVQSEAEIVAACLRLRDDSALRTTLSREAIKLGQKEFDPGTIRQKFLQTIINASSISD